jgi:cytochrome P450/predicted MFS family arabinose efflux permease
MHDAATISLEDIDVSEPELWRTDSHWPYFERLRREDPIHFCRKSEFGPYWSVTRFEDIMAVDTNHEAFSSDVSHGGITILDDIEEFSLPMFIAMDPPRHDHERKVVAPIVAPANLERLEGLIRSRAAKILDELPVGETFDWVDKVSIELTTQMLATLFDFPFEDRHKLTYWSDVSTVLPKPGALVETVDEQIAVLMECLEYFVKLWNERVNAEPAPNLISMLAHGEVTRNMTPQEYLGNVILLIVGGNDTTRNTITGSLLALNQNPDQYQKLREHPELIPSMVSEAVRWQTPLAHMRRTATRDVELGGKLIKKGDKVIMWYVSGNRDSTVIERADKFIIDRERPRQHLSFGFGIHRCVGNRLAEMQLRVLWEEILKRYPKIDVVGEPMRLAQPFVRGYSSLPVRIPPSDTLPPRPARGNTERPVRSRPVIYRQPRRVLAAASAVSSAGALLFNVMPALLVLAASRFSLDTSQMGAVGSSFLAGFAAVATTSNMWISRFNWRSVVKDAIAVAVAGLAACAIASSYVALLAALFLSGAGLGVLYTICIAIVSESHVPDRAFGIKLTAEVSLAIVAMLLLSSPIMMGWGFPGAMLALSAIVGVVALSGLPNIPERHALTPPAQRFGMVRRGGSALASLLRDWAPWSGLTALLISFAGFAALWAYLDQIAPSFGISDKSAADALMVALVVNGASGLAAAFIGDRFGRAKPLAAGLLLAILGAVVLQWGHGFGSYLLAAVLIIGVWNFPMAYQMGMIASSDARGHVAVLMPAALAIGGAVGPMAAGLLLLDARGYLPLYALFTGATAISLVVFVVLGHRLANSKGRL